MPSGTPSAKARPKENSTMSERLSYCGLLCSSCPIYLVAREADKGEQAGKKAEIAKICRDQYGMNIGPSDITDCDGCRAEGGRLFSGCYDCRIRQCAKGKKMESCAHCPEYICRELGLFFLKDPAAKARLDKIRGRIS